MSKSHSVKDDVMQAIESEKVAMHSRRYFIILNIILVVSLASLMALAAVFTNLIVRDVRVGQGLGLGGFGTRGAQEFVSSFPWLLTLLGIVAAAAAVLLVKRFDFSYKHRFYVVIASLVLAVLGVSAIVSVSGLNDPISRFRPIEALSTFSRFAEDRRVIGEISEVGEDFIVIETEDEQISIDISEQTRFPRSYEPQVGDSAAALGVFEDEGFKAFGVGPVSPKGKPKGIFDRDKSNDEIKPPKQR